MNYAAEHNLFADADSLMRAIQGDTVVVDRQVNLVALSKHLEVDVKHLVQLNPTLRKPVTPEKVPFVLNLPAEAADRFRRERTCFLDSSAGCPLSDSETGYRKSKPTLASEGHRITHRIRRRETLTEIAKDYHVALSDLKHWNHLRSGRVRQGQVLVIYSKNKPHKEKAEEEEDEKPAAVAAHTGKAKHDKEDKADKEGHTHEVQPGDTLWNISKRYEGVTVEKLIQLNNLKDKNLKPGMKLILG
jgi:membrane-bound lytic murein transglycosylase D